MTIQNKTVWMLWLQGLHDAPYIVKECYRSWVNLNPSWHVRMLDEKTLCDIVPELEMYLRNPRIPKQALSDIIRIVLLHTHGGVWADATVFCTQPLDEWLEQHASDGFFAFSRPRHDKLLSSWFLYAEPNNALVTKWHNGVERFWRDGFVMPALITKIYQKMCGMLIRLHLTFLVKRPMYTIKRTFGLFPYFWFHYIFDTLYAQDTAVRAQWDRIRPIAADDAHAVLFHGLNEPPSDTIRAHITNRLSPVYKLNWRNVPSETSGTTLQFLLDHNEDVYVS